MVKVLCVHGVGHQEANLAWQTDWKQVIQQQLTDTHPADGVAAEFRFTSYDDYFAPAVGNLSALDVARAVVKLGGGVLPHARAFSLADYSDEARWTAGMVVVWVENDDVRDQAWNAFIGDVDDFQPDLVCAHSLGSLIAYDGFRRADGKVDGRTLLTFGSQLGNFFVRGAFAGQVNPFPTAAFWYHLYNDLDHVFTAPLDFDGFPTAGNFLQVETDFGSPLALALNHDAVNPGAPDNAYLSHPQARAQFWPRISAPAAAPAVSRAIKSVAKAAAKVPDAPPRRALLVGINEYPDPANRLEGCVNDVFLMSSVLQECGFEAEDIRVVLDDRATAAAVLERLHWLLDGTAAGDERFFFYSGHGARLPAYGADGKVERVDACLAPYDFAWNEATAITDDRLVNFYSQLPYDARFMMVLDSCYSGGMTRGGPRVRGLEPPDDIRHRMLRWDAAAQLWVPRELPPADQQAPEGEPGTGGPQAAATRLLGRAGALRILPRPRYVKVRQALGHRGPYKPVVYEACSAQESAYEYRHGVIPYGAFTYALAANLRRHGAAREPVTFKALLDETASTLQKTLDFDQHPVADGPSDILKANVPWQGAGGGATGKRRRGKR
jgi:hypothetical protein